MLIYVVEYVSILHVRMIQKIEYRYLWYLRSNFDANISTKLLYIESV